MILVYTVHLTPYTIHHTPYTFSLGTFWTCGFTYSATERVKHDLFFAVVKTMTDIFLEHEDFYTCSDRG